LNKEKLKPEKVSFEDALKKLEEIASELSEGELPLEESIRLFEKGMELKRFCRKRLDESRRKISILVKDSEEYREEDFKDDSPEKP